MRSSCPIHVFLAVTMLSRLCIALDGPPNASTSAAVPAAMQQYVDWGDIAGAVTLVARDGKILEFDAVGYADVAGKRPMKKESLFWVASMTKPMTSAGILMLLDEGKLLLTDPVEKYLPEFKNPWMVAENSVDRMMLKRPSRLITIRDLLTHTHGLVDPPLAATGTPLAETVASAARLPLQFEPGTQWSYSNAGINTLGRIIEVVSGMSYQDFMQKRFFDPLGMKNTSFYPDSDQLKNLAKSYEKQAGWGSLVETGIGLLNGDLKLKNQTVFPGGGLFSTAEDIFRFYQMLANGGEEEGRRYLAAATVKEMLTFQTGELKAGFSEGMAWGFGVGIVKEPQGWTNVLPVGTWGHDGAYGTTVMVEPKQQLLFIMMIQRGGLNPNRDGLKYRHAFHSVVMKTFSR